MFEGRLAARLLALCTVAAAATTLGISAAHAGTVSLNVVDVAANLQLTQKAFEACRAKYPNLVSNITNLGKIKAMRAAGRADIDLVLTGSDALSAGIEQNLSIKLLPDNSAMLSGVLDRYVPGPRELQDVAQGYGLEAKTKEPREGSHDMPATMTRWAINPRAPGIEPADFRVRSS